MFQYILPSFIKKILLLYYYIINYNNQISILGLIKRIVI